MAALGFPRPLAFPPRREKEETGWPMEKIMEQTSDLFFEADMAMSQFHMLYGDWLKLPKRVRIFQRKVYELRLAKEAYYKTAEEDKRFFFSGSKPKRIGPGS